MLETLKELLSSWKVKVTLVGSAIVVATAYGTCVYEPVDSDGDQVEAAPASNNEANNANTGTTSTGTTSTGTTATGTTNTNTTTTNTDETNTTETSE
jgi:hypothetical protein|tara:strand:- start:3442 stop:3732 length:291 start_codon:yes stop_codon:yes gene_type:complete